MAPIIELSGRVVCFHCLDRYHFYAVPDHEPFGYTVTNSLALSELAAIPEVMALVKAARAVHGRMPFLANPDVGQTGCGWDWNWDEMHAMDEALAPFEDTEAT